MSKNKNEEKQKLTGTWRSIHGAIWLLGLAVLAWQDWWWPGILVLIAISSIAEALIRQYAPNAIEKIEPPAPTTSPAAPIEHHHLDLLPTTCVNCGGPIRGHEVKWTGPQSADCPYCGVNLPMKKK